MPSVISCSRLYLMQFVCSYSQYRGSYSGETSFEAVKGLAEGDRVRDEVYHMPTALQINQLNMKDVLVRVWVTVFL